MIQDVKDLLAQSTGPGDTATILLAGTAGLAVDAGLNVIGFMEPGLVGLSAATAALGLKKSWEANRTRRKIEGHGGRAIERAGALLEILNDKGRTELVHELEDEVGYFRAGVTSEADLDAAVRSALDRLRRPTAITPPVAITP